MLIIPHLPLHMDPIALFGLVLLLGLLGGELVRRVWYLPRILGYLAVGLVAGASGLDLVNPSLLSESRLFVDISLSLILFELGRHLDFSWLRYDKGLCVMALAESSLTWLLIFLVLYFIAHMAWQASALAAAIALATSPAVVMLVARDLSSEGPLTRRTLILTSINNFFSLTLFTLLLPFTANKIQLGMTLLGYSSYRLIGSTLLGAVMFFVTVLLARIIGKHKQSQFILFVSVVVLTIGVAHSLNLSSMFSLFILGAAARNADFKHRLVEVDFGWVARIFIIILFVITGINIKLNGFWLAPQAIILFLAARLIAKISGVWLCKRISRLTRVQAWGLCFTLLPMASVPMGLSNILLDYNPVFGHQLLAIVTASMAILTILGAIVTQIAFLKAGEGLLPDQQRGGLG